jgi:hypothetical protein
MERRTEEEKNNMIMSIQTFRCESWHIYSILVLDLTYGCE